MRSLPKVVACLAAFTLVGTACSSQDQGAGPAPSSSVANVTTPEQKSINIGYNVTLDPTFVPDLASYQCLEDKFSVKADVHTIKGAPASITSLIAGELDITLSTLGAGINAVKEGQDIVAFVPSASAPYFTLMAPATVKKWTDLKGMTFGSTSPSDSSYYTTALLLEKHGLSVDDVKWVTVQGSAARAQAMVGGKIDAGQVTVTEMLEVEKSSSMRKWAAVGEHFPDLIFNAYWVTRDYLKKNPKTLSAFVTCLMTEHREAYDEKLFATKAKSVLPDAYEAETIKKAYQTLIDMNIWDPNEARWTKSIGDSTIKTMAKYEAIEAFVPFDEWATTDLVDQVRKDLGAFKTPSPSSK